MKQLDAIMKRLKDRAKEFAELRAEIHFGSSPHPESGLPMAHHAAIHEFGTADIPARPALHRAASNARDTLKALGRKAAKDMVNGASPADSLVPVAEELNRATVESYESAKSWATPLAESTKRAKGHDKPLDDTHALIDAVGWAIRRKGRFVKRGKV